MLTFSCLLLSFVAYHQFSIALFKTVPVLMKRKKGQRRIEIVRVGRTPVHVCENFAPLPLRSTPKVWYNTAISTASPLCRKA